MERVYLKFTMALFSQRFLFNLLPTPKWAVRDFKIYGGMNMFKGLLSFLATSLMVASVINSTASAATISTGNTVSNVNVVNIAKESSTQEKIAYYQKKFNQLQTQIDRLKQEEKKYAKSSKEYRNVVKKQISLLKQQKYYVLKILELTEKSK